MSKREFLNNTNLNKNISRLKGKSGGRALIIGGPGEKIDNLLSFFDVVIVEEREGLGVCPNPDFYIEKEHTLYKNHKLSYNHLKFKDTVVIVNLYLMEELKVNRIKLDSYTVSYIGSKEANASSSPKEINNMECGLSASSPGLHLALILGCKEVFSYSSGFSTFTHEELIGFTQEKEGIRYGYRPKNFIRKRRQFILERDI